ncbi:MAG: OpgC domain-containing protein [Candidatus Saccharimonadales bacterium]
MPKKKKSMRVEAFDLMRGYFLVSIILNHLHLFPNGLGWLTMRGELFVSAAEGFFLISGIVLGIVRGAKLIDKPFRLGASLLLKRSLQLYITYVILTVGFTLLGWLFFMNNPGLKEGIASSTTSFFTMVWQTMSFQYLYGWADYLRLYCLFLLVSPVILWLLRAGKWWIVLGLSLAVWFATPAPLWPESIFIQPYKWQLLFFTGMTLGFHWPQITEWWQRIPLRWRRISTASVVSIAILTLAFNVFLAFGGKYSDAIYNFAAPLRDLLHTKYFDKENLPFARVILLVVWFCAAFWFFNRFIDTIKRYLGWILLPFGTNSLYVYTIHAFFIFFVHLFVHSDSMNVWINMSVTLGVIALIWIMVRKEFLFKVIPR